MAIEATPAKILGFLRGGVVCVLDDEAWMRGVRRNVWMGKKGRGRGVVLGVGGYVDSVVGSRRDGNTGGSDLGARRSIVGVLLRGDHDRGLLKLDRVMVVKVIICGELLVLEDGLLHIARIMLYRHGILSVVANVGKSGSPG